MICDKEDKLKITENTRWQKQVNEGKANEGKGKRREEKYCTISKRETSHEMLMNREMCNVLRPQCWRKDRSKWDKVGKLNLSNIRA